MIDSLITTLITQIEGPVGGRLRYFFYKGKLKSCKGYFASEAGFRMRGCKHISIGKHVSFNVGVFISASNKIEIGDNCLIGAYTVFRDTNHGYANRSRPIRYQENVKGEIFLGNDVWVGSNCTILKGAKIGEGSIIAAHSLVSKEIPPYEVWGGVPAKFLKVRL